MGYDVPLSFEVGGVETFRDEGFGDQVVHSGDGGGWWVVSPRSLILRLKTRLHIIL